MNSYMCYVRANMRIFKARYPDLCPSDTMKKISEEWRVLSED